jgi:exosortase/archaeosortase family protein
MSIEYLALIRGKEVGNRFILATYLIGLGITMLLNIVRITTIIYLTVNYGMDIGEVFHSVGYELIFLVWILIYIFIVEKLSSKV